MKPYQTPVLSTLLLLLLLSGCSVLNEYYINNYTKSDVLVTLTYSDEAMLPNDTPQITYAALIENIKSGSQQRFKDKLPHQIVNVNAVQFTIPAKSTAFLGLSAGGDKLYTRLQVDADINPLIIEGQEHRDYFEIKDSFVGAIVNVLNVE